MNRVSLAYGAIWMYWWQLHRELEPEQIDFDVTDNNSSITVFVKTKSMVHNSTTILNVEPTEKLIREVLDLCDWVYDNYDSILTNEEEYLIDLQERADEDKFESNRNNLI